MSRTAAADTGEPDDGPRAEVVPLRKPGAATPAPAEPAGVESSKPAFEPGPVGRALARIADQPLPTIDSTRRRVVWTSVKFTRALPRLPWLLVLEVRPVAAGAGRLAAGWSHWVGGVAHADNIKAAEGNTKAKLSADHERRKAMRLVLSLAGLLLVVAGGVWAWLTQPWWWIAGPLVVAVALLDALGRAGRPDEPKSAPALPPVLGTSVPLSQISAAILAALTREGFAAADGDCSVTVARALTFDPIRSEYRMCLSSPDLIKPEHVRAIERAIGARDHAIRNLATDNATTRELVIAVGDPLAGARECEWIPNGSLSFADPLPLGRSGGATDMAVRFLGAHTAVVGATRSGKTEGLLWTMIDRFAACRDLVMFGMDFQAGPAFPLWRGVIAKVAFTPDEGLALVTHLIEIMGQRKTVLTRLAESDDEAHDDAGTVWTADLGPYIVLIVDEFALASIYNGEKNRVDLMTPLEEIIRTGLKFGVHLVLSTQKTGNSDFGSSVMQSQVAIRILLACQESDTVRMLSTAKRDAGWSPHLLKPAQDGDPRDAGKCYIDGPAHTTPDIYRADFWPRGAVKRRARRRLADGGLPTLDGRRAADTDVVDAIEIPRALAAVEAAFAAAGNPSELATGALLGLLAEAGWATDAAGLAKELAPDLTPTRWSRGAGKSIRGYVLADVQAAVRRHEQ